MRGVETQEDMNAGGGEDGSAAGPAHSPGVSGASPTISRHALLFIFFTLLLDTIGLGIIIPIVPRLLQNMLGVGPEDAAPWNGWLAFAYAATQFVCGPIVGSLSDRFGRRPVLFASLLAFGLDYLVLAYAPDLWWLFAGRVVAGIAGASYTTGLAFIADVSPPEKRAQNFGLVGVAFGIGFILGPTLGGLLGSVHIRLPFYVSAALSFINLAYGWLVMPESLPPDRRRAFSWKRANVFGTFHHLRHYPAVLGPLAAMLLWALAHQALHNTWTYYTQLKFDWGEREVGLSLGALGVVIAIMQGGFVRVLIPRWGEKYAATVGMLCVSAAYMGFGVAPNWWLFCVAILVYAPGGLVQPSLQAIMSRAVPADTQGGLQGAVASTIGLASVVGPPIMTNIFHFFSRAGAPVKFPGAPFALASILVVLSIIVLRVAWRMERPAAAPAATPAAPPAAP
jgi:DHA1 family tetracycline resistance protein-like MFS transporter